MKFVDSFGNDSVLGVLSWLKRESKHITNNMGMPNADVAYLVAGNLGLSSSELSQNRYVYLLATIDSLSKNSSDFEVAMVRNAWSPSTLNDVINYAKEKRDFTIEGVCWNIGVAILASDGKLNFGKTFLDAYDILL